MSLRGPKDQSGHEGVKNNLLPSDTRDRTRDVQPVVKRLVAWATWPTLGPQSPRISFGRHNHPFTFTLFYWMDTWMVCIVFHVRVVSEVTPAPNWSLIRGGPPCPFVVKKVCMWSIVNSLSRQVAALRPGRREPRKSTYKGEVKLR